MDRRHLDYPSAGARMFRDLLNLRGIQGGHRRVGTLMQRMGIESLYRKPKTSRKHFAHRIYPCLRRSRKLDRLKQVRAMDITYIPMPRGFVYLVVVDWYSRRVLAWRVSITMDVQFCLDAVQEARVNYGAP